jgi:molybdate transport system substrate-binding protein
MSSSIDTVRLMSGYVVQGVLAATVLPEFERRTAMKVEAQWAPTSKFVQAIAGGARADLAILTDEAIERLLAPGIVVAGSRTRLVRAVVGAAVKKGDRKPDIATVEALTGTLLRARSVAYSRGGASGIYFEKLIGRLGIADAIRSKATVIADGLTGECLVNGKADLAIQQVSELLSVDGVDLVGPFPAGLGAETIFSAAIFSEARNPAGAASLLSALGSADAGKAYLAGGLFSVD